MAVNSIPRWFLESELHNCHLGGGDCWCHNQVKWMMMSSVSGGEMNVLWTEKQTAQSLPMHIQKDI